MPYVNEHAACVKGSNALGKLPIGVRVLEDGRAWRFSADVWTADKARTWLKKNKHPYASFEEAASSASLGYVIDSDASALLLSEEDREGVPVRRYRKELIRDGVWTKESDGITFTCTPSLRQHWAAVFSQMRADGVKVRICSQHTGASDPAKQHGELLALENEGASLYATFELLGKEAFELAVKNDVSLYSPSRFLAGNGKTYVRPITHVAICPDPVITGLAPFQRIAASLSNGKEPDMEAILKALGLEADATAEDILAAIAKLKAPNTSLSDGEAGIAKT